MLRDGDFKMVYSTGEDEPFAFYSEALMESQNLDLGLGFFSSSGFKVLSHGFAYFLSRGGKVRLIINNVLTPKDKLAIEKGQKSSPDQLVEDRLIADVIALQKTLSKQDRHFFNCLSWLIAHDRLSVVAIVPKNNIVGIAHQKFGIFSDNQSNKVAFTGSLNFSESALLYNVETISCYRSWTVENERVNYYSSLFRKIWTGQNGAVEFIPIEKVKTQITSSFPITEIDELLQAELDLIGQQLNTEIENLSGRSLEKLRERIKSGSSKEKSVDKSPKRPFMNRPKNIKIRDYQKKAYANWKSNKYSGIFAMATGTGKTVTAINCVYEEYQENKRLDPTFKGHLMILVPTQPLLEQWGNELKLWGVESIYEVSGKSNWKMQFQSLLSDFEFGLDSEFVIIATYRSFAHDYFQKVIKKLPEDTILIADEAHNIGQPQVRRALKAFPFRRRIGLSATPKRIYDPDGTVDMETFFHDTEPYTFSLFMDEAIESGSLCRYEYYPVLVELEEDELNEYIKISKRLAQLATRKQDDTSNASIEKLLLKRKRIINKARGKLSALSFVIDQLIEKAERIEYCFIYAPPGEWKNNDDSNEQDSIRIIREMQRVFDQKLPGIRTHVYLGETKSRKLVLEGFEKGEINALLAINCLDEGVNVPRTGIGIFTSSTGNPRQYIQRRGRLLRNHPDKNRAVIFDMIVIPKVFEDSKKNDFFKIQKNLVKNELMRVGYFAKLSENFYDSKESLDELCNFYNLDLDTIIKELEE